MGAKSRGNFRMGACLDTCKCPLHPKNDPLRQYKPPRTKKDPVKRKKMPEWMTR